MTYNKNNDLIVSCAYILLMRGDTISLSEYADICTANPIYEQDKVCV